MASSFIHGLGTPAPGTPYEALIRNAGATRSRRGCQRARSRSGSRSAWHGTEQPGEAASAAPRGRPLDPDQRAQDDGGRDRRRLHQHHRDQAGRGGGPRGQAARRSWRTSSSASRSASWRCCRPSCRNISRRRSIPRSSPASAASRSPRSRKKLTIFFSDIADFTATTDDLESEELTALLNHYLTEMSKIALEHGATIDKYVGDAIVAFFGDPETQGRQGGRARLRQDGDRHAAADAGAPGGMARRAASKSRSSFGSASTRAIAPSATSAARTGWTTRSSAAR